MAELVPSAVDVSDIQRFSGCFRWSAGRIRRAGPDQPSDPGKSPRRGDVPVILTVDGVISNSVNINVR